MSQGGVDLERQYLVRAADGTAYWSGLLRAGEIREVQSNEVAATTIGFGEPIRTDAGATGSVWPHWANPATSEPIKGVEKGLRTSGTGNLMLMGVALENIPGQQQGRMAGPGSLVAVKCVNPPTSNATGSAVISDAAAGQVNAVTSGGAYSQTIAHIQPGLALGLVAKPSGAGAGQIGSTTQLGVLVAPF